MSWDDAFWERESQMGFHLEMIEKTTKKYECDRR
jgi:hypothetical protein